MWRPIIAGVTTLHEIDEYWDINDLANANEALDIKAEIEDYYRPGVEDDFKNPVSQARFQR